MSPVKYEKIRDKLIDQGVDEQTAKSKAAAIYNSQRKPGEPPVTRTYDKDHKDSKDK